MWYAGIDWADEHHDVVVIDQAGARVASTRVLHTVDGLSRLVGFLRGIGDVDACVDHLACILETNQGLLISSLLDAGLPVYPVNPKTVDRHRKASGAKTDDIDAYLLARTGRSDLADLRRLQPDSALVTELKLLTHDQDTLIQSQTRLSNQIIACLKDYYPVALTLFSKIQQPSTLGFLRSFPTLVAARTASVEEIATVLKTAGYAQATSKAELIVRTVTESQLEAPAEVTRARSRLLLSLVGQLDVLLPAIAAYDAEISRLFLMHSDSRAFASLPRAGMRLAPRLLAEWGDDRERYDTVGSIQALAGTSPVVFQSGKYLSVHRRQACNKPLRNALHQFAWQSTLAEPWALAFYQRKRREGKTHSMAVRALSNHWVRIIYALWTKREAYNADIFVAAQKAHSSAIAA